MHDDRINDGQSMTLDQCLSCTRYEPIIGQIYAILDESGTNISQVVDDIQMAYMNIDEYVSLTRNEEIHFEKNLSTVNKTVDTEPVKFKDVWDEGFKMLWNDSILETHTPHISEYKAEGIGENKSIPTSDNQKVPPPEFKDTREENTAYEEFKFNSSDYDFGKFGEVGGASPSSPNNLGLGATELRNKIVEYAKMVQDRCSKGTAGYSQSSRGTEVGGILYHDCSSLVAFAYKNAGIEFGSYTGNQYPLCYKNAGGLLWPVEEVDKALPGDVIFFATYPNKPSDLGFPANPDELSVNAVGSIGHIAVYIGDKQMIEATTDEMPLNSQIRKRDLLNYPNIYCFGRCKALIDADAKANSVGAASDVFNAEKQKLPTDLMQPIKDKASGWANSVISNNQIFDYYKLVKESCKTKSTEHGVEIDPLMMLAIAGVESGGDPYAEGCDPGMYQLSPGAGGATMPSNLTPKSEEANKFLIEQTNGAIDMLMGKRNDIINIWGEEYSAWHYGIYGYNSGQGTVSDTIKTYSLKPQTGGEFAEHIYNFVNSGNSVISLPQVRYEYFARVLWVYNLICNKL